MNLRDLLQRARAGYWLRRCARVGRGAQLHGRPTVMAAAGIIQIGERFRLASKPVASHLVAGPGAVLEIGHDVSIGAGAAIAAFEHVQIGDGTRIGPFVILMDTNFHGSPGQQSIEHDCRPVIIGSQCRIGSRVTITRGATIGDGARILSGSVVTSAIPAGMCAAGSRARVVGRADQHRSWRDLEAGQSCHEGSNARQ